MNSYGQKFSLTSTSPSAPTTAVGATVEGLGDYSSLVVLSTIRGATGGTLDVYLQTSIDQEGTATGVRKWADVVHYSQALAAAAETSYAIGLSRWGTEAAPTVVAYATNTTVTLGANTVVPGVIGRAMRVVYKAGASTSAGASQVIDIYGSV